jgi:capsular polysaccharide transport system ATP-binding protein
LEAKLTGRDNVKFVCRIQGVRGAGMKEKIRFVQEFAELGEYFDRPVSGYSSGMRARLAFGASMAFEFDYYLIDEVMAVGDARFRKRSRALFQERLKDSKLILVSHNMKLIRTMCDSVVLLENGRANYYDDASEGIAAYRRTGDKP